MITALLIGFIISWAPHPFPDAQMEIWRGYMGQDAALIGICQPGDTLYEDAPESGQRYFYYLIAIDPSGYHPSSQPSNIVSGLEWIIQPEADVHSREIRRAGENGEHLLLIEYPSGPWEFTWDLGGGREELTARSGFDFNSDGEINLSDFSFFGEDYGIHGQQLWDLSDFSMFGAIYNGPGYYHLELIYAAPEAFLYEEVPDGTGF